MFRRAGWIFCFCLSLATGARAFVPNQTYGPLYHREQDAHHEETDAMGPFLTAKEFKDEDREEFGLRPAFYRAYTRDPRFIEWDAFYPLFTYDRIENESRVQFIQLISFATSGRENGVDKRYTLFPFLFIDRSVQPKQSYWAFFPLYGTLKDRLTFRHVFFVVFPLYVDWQKKDVRTRYVVFPFFSWSGGENIHGWRFFPFYGWQTKKDAYDKRYLMFPFWIRYDQFWDPAEERHARASLPFFYHEWTPTRDAVTVLWPFVRHVDDRKRQYKEWDFPWPLWVYARGKDYNISRAFPLYGSSQDKDRRGYMFLFPLWKWNIADQPEGTVESSRFLFYLMVDNIKTRTATHQTARRVESLPIFQYKRDYDGNISFQTLALLEPMLPQNKSIAREYSPLWTLFQYSRSAHNDAAMNSLLWNLWRWERQGDARKVSLLMGLFQLDKEGDQRALRLLYLPPIHWGSK